MARVRGLLLVLLRVRVLQVLRMSLPLLLLLLDGRRRRLHGARAMRSACCVRACVLKLVPLPLLLLVAYLKNARAVPKSTRENPQRKRCRVAATFGMLRECSRAVGLVVSVTATPLRCPGTDGWDKARSGMFGRLMIGESVEKLASVDP